MGASGGVAMLGLVLALAHEPAHSIALTIDVTPLMPMSDAQLRAMVIETNAPWKPHRVVFRWITSTAASDPPLHGVVRVLSEGCRLVPLCLPVGTSAGESRPAGRRLGAVVFPEGSATPDDTLMLSMDAVVQAVEQVTWQNRRLADLPTDTRGYLVGRALGRVLAHELGHYLLASRSHARTGLMRPEFRADQLIGLSRNGFALSETEMPLLRLRLVQLAERSPDLTNTHDGSPIERR